LSRPRSAFIEEGAHVRRSRPTFVRLIPLAAAGLRKEALGHLLEIVRRDRTWNDDGARKELVKLFEAWGPKDEHTIAGRKRLSSLLFA
ncbi:tetratricopeptide repeat protein, partial [Hansschlegelia beijingensis]